MTNHFQTFNYNYISNNNIITIKINNYISIWINFINNKYKLSIYLIYIDIQDRTKIPQLN